MRHRKAPSALAVLALYSVGAGALARLVAVDGDWEPALFSLLIPSLLAALYYPRPVYLLMSAMAVAFSTAAVYGLHRDPDSSLRTIVGISLAVMLSCELLQYIVRSRFLMNERLRQTTDQLQALFRAAPLAIFSLDLCGAVQSWNPAASRLLGWTEVELLGKPLPLLDEDLAFLELRMQVLTGEKVTDVETACRTQDGRLVEVSISAAPLYDARGGVHGLIVLLSDSTARKEAEQAAHRLIREQAARALAEAGERRVQFLSEASSRLVSSLDYHDTLKEVAALAVPFLGDFCAFDLDAGHSVERVAAVHRDPLRMEAVEEIGRRYPVTPEDRHGPGAVLRTGATIHLPVLHSSALALLGRDAAHVALLRRLGLTSYLCVPLSARGRVLGALTLAVSDGGWEYGPEELSLAQDLANRAAMAIENAGLYRAAQSADQAKSDFLAMLAHELRNPLAAISNASHLLEEIPPSGPRAERLRGIIGRQTEHLSRLVDDLLDVSRISHGKVDLRKEQVALEPLAHGAVEIARPLIEARRHTLLLQLPEEPVWLEGDPVRLGQVISNLLTNAARYTDPGGRIRLMTRVLLPESPASNPVAAVPASPAAGPGESRAQRSLEIRVQDNGMGIAPKMLPHIFEAFTQVQQAPDRSQGGLGLGLALVKTLVQMHGGTVEARSEGPGAGSEFIVRLPLPASPPSRPAHPGPRESGSRAPVSLRALVVDDNIDAAETLAELLGLWGHQVRVAHDGFEALAAAGGYRPDVVLCDLDLPGMNGYEVTRRIRAVYEAAPAAAPSPDSPRPPGREGVRGARGPVIIALTGYGSEDDRRRAREAGFDHHLVKPVDPDLLGRLLEDVPADAGREPSAREESRGPAEPEGETVPGAGGVEIRSGCASSTGGGPAREAPP